MEKRIVNTPGGGELLTKQADKTGADINYIVSQFGKTGQWTNVNPRTPTYGDFTGPTELLDAIALVDAARRDFMALPAEVRALAQNNPVTFLEMMADEDAVAVLEKMGLPIEKPKTDTTTNEGPNPLIKKTDP